MGFEIGCLLRGDIAPFPKESGGFFIRFGDQDEPTDVFERIGKEQKEATHIAFYHIGRIAPEKRNLDDPFVLDPDFIIEIEEIHLLLAFGE